MPDEQEEDIGPEPVAYHWHILCESDANDGYLVSGSDDVNLYTYACDTATKCYWAGCNPIILDQS